VIIDPHAEVISIHSNDSDPDTTSMPANADKRVKTAKARPRKSDGSFMSKEEVAAETLAQPAATTADELAGIWMKILSRPDGQGESHETLLPGAVKEIKDKCVDATEQLKVTAEKLKAAPPARRVVPGKPFSSRLAPAFPSGPPTRTTTPGPSRPNAPFYRGKKPPRSWWFATRAR
jgi:hypothetical protein